jgi:hypothetical protein
MAHDGIVYLIHFARPYRHAQHYLGWTQGLERRIAEHRAGHGSPLVAAAVSAGIEIQLAATWPGDRNLERRLHRYNNSPRRLCPICRGEPTAAATITRQQLDSVDELAIAALTALGQAVTLPVLTGRASTPPPRAADREPARSSRAARAPRASDQDLARRRDRLVYRA